MLGSSAHQKGGAISAPPHLWPPPCRPPAHHRHSLGRYPAPFLISLPFLSQLFCRDTSFVSTHAPARGATSVRQRRRHRAGVSTHAPARGATASQPIRRRSRAVSTHAPARGATIQAARGSFFPEFQLTRPRGARPQANRYAVAAARFQLTRPRGARRHHRSPSPLLRAVSTHAPARGATLQSRKPSQATSSFNSRAREGRDLRLSSEPFTSMLFQLTRPRGARRRGSPPPTRQGRFQLTRPRGARPSVIGFSSTGPPVSTHAPARGATSSGTASGAATSFNSRAREGRDLTAAEKRDLIKLFQLTRPRGARLQLHLLLPL